MDRQRTEQPMVVGEGATLDLGGAIVERHHAVGGGGDATGLILEHGSVLRRAQLDGRNSKVATSAKAHGIRIQGKDCPGVLIEHVDVSGWRHAGIYVGPDARARLVGITGSGCGFGAICVVGTGSKTWVSGARVDVLHVEVERVGAPTRVWIRDSVADSMGLTLVNAGSTVYLDRIRVGPCAWHSPVWVEAHDLVTGPLDIVQPGFVRVADSAIVGAISLRYQTQWRTGLGQRVELRRCAVGGPITVQGRGQLHLDAGTRATVIGAKSRAAGMSTVCEIYVDGERAAELRTGQTWSTP